MSRCLTAVIIACVCDCRQIRSRCQDASQPYAVDTVCVEVVALFGRHNTCHLYCSNMKSLEVREVLCRLGAI